MNQTNINELDALKREFGKEAIFRSKAGFEFNAFDDTWLLNALGNSGQSVSLTWLHDSQLADDEQIIARLAFATYAKKRSAQSVKTCIYGVKKMAFESLTVTAFKSTWLTVLNCYQATIKTFVKLLVEYDEARFNAHKEWSDNVSATTTKKTTLIYDPTQGALSDLENQALNVAMNQRSKEVFARGFDVTREGWGDGTRLLTFCRSFIAIRFVQVLVRRPANLIQMKWADIQADANVLDAKNTYFDDDDELKVRIYKAKQQGSGFRQLSEGWQLTLNNAISKEVLRYRQAYQSLLLLTFEKQGVILNEFELNELMSQCPVFFTESLFRTEFTEKKQIFAAVGRNTEGFHLDSITLNATVQHQFQSLNVVSERVSADLFRITNNRIRHTVGTKASRENIDVNHIGRLLGNSPEAAKVYVDLSDEQRATINKKMAGNTFLATAFSTNVSTVLKEYETVIETEFGGAIGKSKNVAVCVNCARQKPLGCYGCNNFCALACANHRSQLEKAEGIHNHRIKTGDHANALLELDKQIENIKATIIACDNVLSKQSILEVKNADQI